MTDPEGIQRFSRSEPLGREVSRIEGCYFHIPDDQVGPIFSNYHGDPPGRLQVNLRNYAIIPIEMFLSYEASAKREAERQTAAFFARRSPPIRPIDRLCRWVRSILKSWSREA